jgi:hypothetical protein
LSPFSAALLDSQLSLLGLGRTRFAHSVLRTKQGIAATATRLASHDRNSKRDLRLASAATHSFPRLQTLAASSPLHRLCLSYRPAQDRTTRPGSPQVPVCSASTGCQSPLDGCLCHTLLAAWALVDWDHNRTETEQPFAHKHCPTSPIGQQTSHDSPAMLPLNTSVQS